VAWRAQLMGWKCLYAPYARGYHVRKVLPGNRGALPPEINMHSVKNRFLMRIKNIRRTCTGAISFDHGAGHHGGDVLPDVGAPR
jgi:GT2 family glycosyltransferase